MSEKFLRPAGIEAESMRLIEKELQARGIELTGAAAPVIRRVIHTTADFDYVENLVFSPGAAERGMEALARGAAVITDTNMALAGVSRPGLARLGCRALCFMADPAVAEEAARRGITRAAAAAERAAALYPDGVFAVGNAPTALMTLAERIRGGLRPALVAAVPVGFVNVVEAKEEIIAVCAEADVPVIAARGRKGGSTVAAAIVNALLYGAADALDPETRARRLQGNAGRG